jgi:branched-chain amino acid transport system substrate-binding protein
MEQAGATEPARYLPVLARIEHPGITGIIAFDRHGDIRNGTLTLYTFRNGQRTSTGVIK